ncbi:magnesium-translocating P-type ATPase [Coniochaeta sp. 2T2.1]|nr:magnesium-translocating P-type ATPase [Coniochaeta sp. 2T2.1]
MSRKEGLTPGEVCAREKLVGSNILSVKEKRPWWKLLLSSIGNPFNSLLVALMVLAVATPDRNWVNFGVVVLMLSLSCCARFIQEFRANLAAVKLQSGVERLIQVRRPRPKRVATSSYLEESVEFKRLVPGDVVMLNPGDNVPADCLLLETSRLHISRSSLTGETMPQEKNAGTVSDKLGKAIFDLPNIAFMGTSVVSGTGVAIVISTGDQAFIASIREQLDGKQPQSAFDAGIERVSYMLIGFMVVMVAVVLVIRGMLSKDWAHAAQFSLTVAVGIVPEMLPTIINANLVRGASLLKRKGLLVKPLAAVQNLGTMSILCSDKTGTLTKDEMTLATAEDCSAVESNTVLRMAYTNAFYQKGKKNQIDAALLRKQEERAEKACLDDLIMEIPFEFEKRRSSVVVQSQAGRPLLICKGAFEEVINLCTDMQVGDRTVHLAAASRQSLFARVHTLNDDGYRVLGVATRVLPLPVNEDTSDTELCKEMVFEGILTFLDPPRDDAAEAIASLQDLGVRVKVLTGDNARIATKLCRTLNVQGTQDVDGSVIAFTGPQLEQMTPANFSLAVQQATVLAKLTPSQKGDVVRALKSTGQAVGMLGDGMNDCIALSVADVGISVKNAVTAAQDCADVILTEKCLNIIVAGVRAGRLVHGNSMKYIKMVTSSNFGNVLSIVIASSWLPYQPMSPTQILVQNLLYDFSQMAIPWDRMDESYLSGPHRWSVWDLLRFIVCFGPTSSVIDITTFCLGWFFYGVRTADDMVGVPMVNTHWFWQGLLTQVLIVHVLRTADVPILRSRSSWVLALATVTIMSVGVALPYIPFLAGMIGLVKPAYSFIGFLAAELVVYCAMVQVVKMVYARCFGAWI